MGNLQSGIQPKSLPADDGKRCGSKSTNKRKTDTRGFYDLAAAYQPMHVNY
jgi:hypothetical protein